MGKSSLPPPTLKDLADLAYKVYEHPLLKTSVDQLHAALQPLWVYTKPHVNRAQAALNQFCEGLEAWHVVCVTVVATVVLIYVLSELRTRWRQMQEDGGLLPAFFATVRRLPFMSGFVAKEKAKMRAQLLAQRGTTDSTALSTLPAKGRTSAQVLEQMVRRQKEDAQVPEGASRLTGSVYMAGAAHKQLLNDAFYMFSLTNPLHADIWPSLRQMEAEVVAMTASFLGGGPGTRVCGSMTSGGSESILLAMKAARDWAKATRGIRHPEMVVARSAHPAYVKAAEYFKIKLVVVPVGADLRLSGRAVQSALTPNTVVVVASAPGYPHGVIDHVEDIAKVCRRAGVCLHVDACLGGFVLPFARKLGRPVPTFDFSVPGVTSMSVDTHKYGLAHKGTSVVLYSTPELRAHQFTAVTNWTGGMYSSPSMAGSRSGGILATAWAAMVAMGEEGYTQSAAKLYDLRDKFVEGVKNIPELQVLGDPDMCVVAFTNNPDIAPTLNPYKIKDYLGRSGWHTSALQSPPGLHFAFTPAHCSSEVDVVAALLSDLRQACQKLLADPECVQGGTAPMYGVAQAIPDKKLIDDFLIIWQECQLDL